MAKFLVEYTFHGRSTATIEAASLEAAKATVDAEVNRDDFEIDADECDAVDFTVREMHAVTRDGRELWTTYVMPGDIREHISALATTSLFGAAP